MKITPKMLREKDACDSQVEKFEKWLSRLGREEIYVTPHTLQEAVNRGLDIDWFISHFKPRFAFQVTRPYGSTLQYHPPQSPQQRLEAAEKELAAAKAALEVETIVIKHDFMVGDHRYYVTTPISVEYNEKQQTLTAPELGIYVALNLNHESWLVSLRRQLALAYDNTCDVPFPEKGTLPYIQGRALIGHMKRGDV